MSLVKQGQEPQRASERAFNGRGPWWNDGSPPMNAALPTRAQP
jgi:hypothetical protein